VSQFDDVFAESAVPEMLERMGTTIRYVPVDADPVELTAAISELKDRPEAEDDGRKRVKRLLVAFSTDPDSPYGGVPNPATNAKIEIAGVSWPIGDIDLGGGVARVTVERHVPVERSRSGYRK